MRSHLVLTHRVAFASLVPQDQEPTPSHLKLNPHAVNSIFPRATIAVGCCLKGILSRLPSSMDSTPNTDRSKAFESHTSSSKSFFARTIIRGDDRSSTEPVKGPLNLTTLYKPVNNATAVDLVFVHGLNGGSYSTWSRGGNPAYMWPKEWLPKDEAFQDVRIHTFGYSSGVNRDSILDIQDFAQTLLATIKDAPAIPREEKVCFQSSDRFLSALHVSPPVAAIKALSSYVLNSLATTESVHIPLTSSRWKLIFCDRRL